MSKLTIVTDRRGKLIGAVQGHELSAKVGEVEAHVEFAPGHKLHKVDVDIDMSAITDPKEFEIQNQAAHSKICPESTGPRVVEQKILARLVPFEREPGRCSPAGLLTRDEAVG